MPDTHTTASFVAIDLETATQYRSSICQIGITIVEDGQIVKTISHLVRPRGNYYDYLNISIHGIRPSDTRNSPSFEEVWHLVEPYMRDKMVVAHNSAFDMYALKEAFDENRMQYPSFEHMCTLRLSRKVFPNFYSYTLDSVLSRLGIAFSGHHKADNDSWGCAQIFLRCLEKEGSDYHDLERKYGFTRGEFSPAGFVPQKSKNWSVSALIKELEDHPELHCPQSPLFGRSIAFTGTFTQVPIWKLLQEVKDTGGVPSASVGKKTSYLVIGQKDYWRASSFMDDAKTEKAKELIAQGIPLKIISENDLLDLLGK